MLLAIYVDSEITKSPKFVSARWADSFWFFVGPTEKLSARYIVHKITIFSLFNKCSLFSRISHCRSGPVTLKYSKPGRHLTGQILNIEYYITNILSLALMELPLKGHERKWWILKSKPRAPKARAK